MNHTIVCYTKYFLDKKTHATQFTRWKKERIDKSSKNVKEKYSANYTEIEMKIMLFPANKQHIKTVIE